MKQRLTRYLKCGLLASMLVLSVGEANALDLVVRATAEETKLGFEAGQMVTVTYTVNPDFVATPNTQFYETMASWGSGWGDIQIFSHIAITGVSGTYALDLGGEPSISVSLTDEGGVSFYNWTASLGYEAGGENVWSVAGDLSLSLGGIFSLPTSYVDPTAYFTNYLGTFGVSESYYVLWTGDSSEGVGPNTDSIRLNVVDFSVVAPVPEPGSVALLSIGALGALWMARRRRIG